MTAAQINTLVGRKRGQHCWDFVRDIMSTYYSVELPPLAVDMESLAAIGRAFRDNVPLVLSEVGLVSQPYPQDADIVAMSNTLTAAHVGVYLEAGGGGVLHMEIHKPVSFTKLSGLAWQHIDYYRAAV